MQTDDIEHQTCAFVVRVWLEDDKSSMDDRDWRGHVTHVLSSERQHFQEFDVLIAFIEQHIELMREQDDV